MVSCQLNEFHLTIPNKNPQELLRYVTIPNKVGSSRTHYNCCLIIFALTIYDSYSQLYRRQTRLPD
jgi:hypothetical protein